MLVQQGKVGQDTGQAGLGKHKAAFGRDGQDVCTLGRDGSFRSLCLSAITRGQRGEEEKPQPVKDH